MDSIEQDSWSEGTADYMDHLDSAQLIPDQPLTEFLPVAWQKISPFRKFVRALNFGDRGRARKAWVNSAAPREGVLALTHSVDVFHCAKDAELIWRMGKPSPGMLPEFEAASVEVSGTRDDVIALRWKKHGLEFDERVYVSGSVIGGVLAISRGASGASAELERTVEETRSRVAAASSKRRGLCWHLLGRWSWMFAILLVAFFGTGVARELGGSVLGLLVGLGGLGCLFYFLFVLDPRRIREMARRSWALTLEQGDADGTVRRALASIGVDLPSPQVSA